MGQSYPNATREVSATTDGKVKVRAYDGTPERGRLIYEEGMTKEQAQAFADELLAAVRMLGGVA